MYELGSEGISGSPLGGSEKRPNWRTHNIRILRRLRDALRHKAELEASVDPVGRTNVVAIEKDLSQTARRGREVNRRDR